MWNFVPKLGVNVLVNNGSLGTTFDAEDEDVIAKVKMVISSTYKIEGLWTL